MLSSFHDREARWNDELLLVSVCWSLMLTLVGVTVIVRAGLFYCLSVPSPRCRQRPGCGPTSS